MNVPGATMIQNTPTDERPRERCLSKGSECLSLRECLALILGSGPKGKGCMGLAAEIMSRPGQGLGCENEEFAFFTAMEVSPLAYITEFPGLGPAGRARIMAAFELGRRYALFREKTKSDRIEQEQTVSPSTKALATISDSLRNDPQEWLGFVPLHRSGKLGRFSMVERGTRTHVNIDPAELFARILALRPQGFFLFHNHPSGNLYASAADHDLTLKVKAVSSQFGIELLGHWIVCSHGEKKI